MVMGPPYDYDRVRRDCRKYPQSLSDGTFSAWWETYLREEGFGISYRPFRELCVLEGYRGALLGVLGMDFPALKAGHVVAVDELGVVDPADNSPDHEQIRQYILERESSGANFHEEWLAVTRPATQ